LVQTSIEKKEYRTKEDPVGFLTAVGIGAGVSAGVGALSGILNQLILYLKWKAFKWMARPVVASILDKIVDAEKDPVHGLSTAGQVDAIMDFIDRTIDFAWFTDISIASQMFVQLMQQSIAYAISASHAGSIGTVCNVYSGGQSIHPVQSMSVGECVDLMDRGTKAFISASAGLNIPTLAFNLQRGVNRRIEDVYQRIMVTVDGLLDEWNDQALNYYRRYITLARQRLEDAITLKEDVVTRAYGLLERMANEHLARITELVDTLEGAKAWFDAGLMSADELKQIAVRIDLERQASEYNYDEMKGMILDAVDSAMNEHDTYIEQALKDLQKAQYKFCLIIRDIFGELFNDVYEFAQAVIDEVDKVIQDVCAYRNVKQAVHVEMTNMLGETEASPETEVYPLRWTRVKEVQPITIIYEYQRPHGLPWQDADPTREEISAYDVGVTGWEEVDYPEVKFTYDRVTELSWRDP